MSVQANPARMVDPVQTMSTDTAVDAEPVSLEPIVRLVSTNCHCSSGYCVYL